ncbi:hypothetical protein BGZ79_008133 [Entomortierella chlamydospora]|nr:hypothetical protein BGZ79_008133 [Entomortierella chlamydospora]
MKPEKSVVVHDNIKYRIRVSAGPDTKSLRPIAVNDDANPFLINTDEFAGHLTFRIKGQDQIHGYEQGQKQDGLPIVPDSPWFENAADGGKGNNLIMCMQAIGRFKREWSGEQVVLAVVFDKPFKLPTGTSLAIKFFKAISPGLQVDVQGTEPYFINPFLTAMDCLHVSKDTCESTTVTAATVPAWPSPRAENLPENTSLIILEEDPKKKAKIEMDTKARKHHFAKAKNLRNHWFVKDHVYGLELFNPFMDCARLAVKLPGLFSLELFKVLNEQPITYSIRTQDGSVSFFAVSFELVPVVEDLSNV